MIDLAAGRGFSALWALLWFLGASFRIGEGSRITVNPNLQFGSKRALAKFLKFGPDGTLLGFAHFNTERPVTRSDTADTPVLVRVPRVGCALRLPMAGPACPLVADAPACRQFPVRP